MTQAFTTAPTPSTGVGARAGRVATVIGKWTVGTVVWMFQYAVAFPCYAAFRFFARFSWATLAVCTLGLSVLWRHFSHKGDRRHNELMGRSTERYSWSAVSRPWLKDWVTA